ncbi:MAG: hypothetical protein PF482_20240 [Desulfobacteraceae bacterium]|nr:hypothetical protein [Desulfobacteraceae bacterium]
MFIELKKEHLKFTVTFILITISLFISGCATPVNKQNLDIDKLIEEENYEKVAIAFYLFGRDEEYKKSGDAREIYENALKLLAIHESDFHENDIPRLNKIWTALLSRYFFCSIEEQHPQIVDRVSKYILENTYDEVAKSIVGRIYEDKQYVFFQHCLIPVHLFYTGNFSHFKEATIKLNTLISNKKDQTSILTSPWYYTTDLMVDEAFVSIFLGYSMIQDGDLSGASIVQEEMENLYESPLIKTLLWGGDTLGIAKTERAMVLGFGAYGYSLLGQYNKSKKFFIEAISCLDDQDLKLFDRIVLSMLHAGYADCYLIPALDKININEGIQEIEKHFEKSEKILPNEFEITDFNKLADPNLEYGINLAKAYRLVTNAKYLFKIEKFNDSFFAAEKSLEYLKLTSPKQLTIDAIYYAVLSAVKENRLEDAEKIFSKYDGLLIGYRGFELWKLLYAYSLVYEKNGDITKALELAKKSVLVVEVFRRDRFPGLLQQVTFMEDKSLPYEQVINLLLQADMSETDREAEVFQYIEKVKIHSLLLLGDKDKPFAKNVITLNV